MWPTLCQTPVSVAAATDTGVWQSVGHIVSDIPSVVKRLRGRIAEGNERIATIDRELARLANWDGQATYDAAMSELQAINAVFAAEEQAGSEQGQATATQPSGGTTPLTPSPSDETTLDDVLLALAREEGAGDGWGAWEPVIPPAPNSLAWMAAEIERQPLHSFSLPEGASQACAVATGASATEADLGHTPIQTPIQFGDVRGQRCAHRPPSPIAPQGDAEVSQLPLF